MKGPGRTDLIPWGDVGIGLESHDGWLYLFEHAGWMGSNADNRIARAPWALILLIEVVVLAALLPFKWKLRFRLSTLLWIAAAAAILCWAIPLAYRSPSGGAVFLSSLALFSAVGAVVGFLCGGRRGSIIGVAVSAFVLGSYWIITTGVRFSQSSTAY